MDIKKILIITDAWMPQTNGVVRTLTSTIAELQKMGREVRVISPDQFRTVPCPTYPEIRLAIPFGKKISQIFTQFQPDAVHIATEGPLGFFSRIWLCSQNIPFTTSFATKFPEYIQERFKIPPDITYRVLRWFHAKSHCVMVATDSVKRELSEKGFQNLAFWGKGVDKGVFYPRDKHFLKDKRPILLYAGRVSAEKNLKAFLSLNLEGSKYVVGDGPELKPLKARYPDARFAGVRHGEELARYYSAADVFVFPSLTDTFGLVMVEALACGVPVAAFPVTGPGDVIGDSGAGALDTDLLAAVKKALTIPSEKCVAFAARFSWEHSTRSFLSNLRQIEKRP